MRKVFTEKFQWVCESRIPGDGRRGPLKTSVSRKPARSDEISQVNLIVGWNELIINS